MAEVKLSGVSKTYANGVRALNQVDLTVPDGELVVILGPSGGGKTTTLRLIAGLEAPSAGAIHIGGTCVNDQSPRERDVAIVFQKPALYPHLTVRQNLEFALRLRGPGRWLPGWFRGRANAIAIEPATVVERVEQAAALLGLTSLLGRYPRQLSGGEQQRVALGRGLVRRPQVFLLDEPLSHLDARLRAELRKELHLLQRRLAATMIYVTHDQAEAMTLADRLVVLDGGVVLQAGTPLGVYDRPCHRLVAGFLGSPPMNFIDGRMESTSSGWQFVFAEGRWTLPRAMPLPELAEPGRAVTLGIRPENLVLGRGEGENAALKMQVALIEYLGDSCWVTLRGQEQLLTARILSRQVPGLDTKIEVSVPMEKVHWFDRVTGVALGHPRLTG